MNKKLVLLGILLLVGLTLAGCVAVGGYGYGYGGYDYGYGSGYYSYPHSPATTITIIDIPIEITIPVTGVTVIMDQGMDPLIGDKIIGQGGRIIF
jgi:hypothetical protein